MKQPLLITNNINFIADEPFVVIWSDLQGSEFSTLASAVREVHTQAMFGNPVATGARLFVCQDDTWQQVEF
jgi:hypothetical protein